jgi:hypothetical protein
VANATYHRYECKIYDFLIASGMSIICFMAYRTITQKPLQFFLEHRDKFDNHDEVAGSKNSEVRFSKSAGESDLAPRSKVGLYIG